MGCTCREAEKFLTAGLADVLKPGYESFERPRFERGTCCELLDCQKLVQPTTNKWAARETQQLNPRGNSKTFPLGPTPRKNHDSTSLQSLCDIFTYLYLRPIDIALLIK